MDELKSVKDVKEWLTSHAGVSWIASSSRHLRAFYWGLYCGLGLDDSERAGRESVLARMWADTMSQKPADDPFRLTDLCARVERLRVHLYKRIEAGHREAAGNSNVDEAESDSIQVARTTEELSKSLLDCVQSLDRERAAHRERIEEELGRTRSASPTEVLRALDRLDESLRILAVGDRPDPQGA